MNCITIKRKKTKAMTSLKQFFQVLILMGINANANECPDYWTVYGSSCYFFGHQALDFFSAEHYCRQHNGYLVHINDEGENTFLREHVRYMSGARWWIGLTDDDVENTFVWYGTKQRPEFTDWAKGQPDDYENDEDCVEINKGVGYGNHWNDATCSNHELPICERPTFRMLNV